MVERAAAEMQTSRPEPGEAPRPPGLFLTNLFMIGLLGVALSGWILYYTDYFEIFGGLLSLTGLFSWLAFISRALPADRLEGLQTSIDKYVLGSWSTAFFVGVIFLLGAVATCFLGTVQVEATDESGDHSLSVSPLSSQTKPGEAGRLPAGAAVRSLIRTSLVSPTTVRVKVGGYPDLVTTVRPWERVRLYAPSSFLRPVVLIKPTVALIDLVGNSGMTLSVSVDKQPPRRSKFDGHAVWIGCDDDVQLPPFLQDVFRGQLRTPEHVPLLLYPVQTPGDRLELRPGNRVEVKLLRAEDDGVYTSAQFAVLRLQRRQDFPQVEVLDVPH